ncbi:pyruvate kinase [Paenibacillus silvae]|uniref:pyruvate kinase n=1 Tax=Paenibacillus TaxID=44249 RepID=UPI0011A5BA4E|nr:MULTISPECIES: pyruvate kinase [Paenibacillus]MBU5353682.1 pyruvate kinase [Paenibacillus barcinonensis]
MQIDINKLYNKYITLDIPNRFTLEQIYQTITEKYFAVKVDMELFSDLRLDPYASFETAVAAYSFPHPEAVKRLSLLNNTENSYDISWIINSEDNVYMSGGTIRGVSFILDLEIAIFNGMDEEEKTLGNPRFEEFLIILYLTGYIKFQNDPHIEELVKRYKEGYYLRYFGHDNGSGNYLYK